ncbi:hypothetical protein RCO48_28675 [Peribacillus frigoritolerans]|nr:hypothetical protein [Peribacillus frigoritolerans]
MTRAFGNLIELGRNNDQVLARFQESYSKETGPKFTGIWNETEAILNNVQLTMEEGAKVLPEVRTLLNETNRTLETRTGDIDKLQNKFPEIENEK